MLFLVGRALVHGAHHQLLPVWISRAHLLHECAQTRTLTSGSPDQQKPASRHSSDRDKADKISQSSVRAPSHDAQHGQRSATQEDGKGGLTATEMGSKAQGSPDATNAMAASLQGLLESMHTR